MLMRRSSVTVIPESESILLPNREFTSAEDRHDLTQTTDRYFRSLLLRPRERMTTQFAAERVTNLRDNLDLRRVIIFRVFELVHGMLVIDRVGRKMDQITRIVAEETCAEKTGAFCIRRKFTKPEIVA